MRISRIFLIGIVTFLLTACSWSQFPFLYKPDVQQGNQLTDDRIAAITLGMSQDQVNYLLGNPILTNVINTQKTEYVYTFQSGKKPAAVRTLRLTFDHDRLVTIEK